jgi:hypothetical protein
MPRSWFTPLRMMAPLLLVVVLALLWTAYWFVAFAKAREIVARERQAMAAQGTTLDCVRETWGGFPFRFEFLCDAPKISHGGSAIRLERLLAVALAYNPKQVAVLLDGPTTITVSAGSAATVLHRRALASVTFDKDWRPHYSADVPEIVVPDVLRAARLVVNASSDIALAIDRLHIDPPNRPALEIGRSVLKARLVADRYLDVEHIELSQGGVSYWGTGSIGLDRQNRIVGRLATETNDLDALLTIVAPHFRLSDQERSSVRLVFGLLGQNARAAIVASEGSIFIGPYRVGELAPLF